MWNSRRRAAGVCAGGAWQERSSPGGSEDCRVDRSTPGLKRPERVDKRGQKHFIHLFIFIFKLSASRELTAAA